MKLPFDEAIHRFNQRMFGLRPAADYLPDDYDPARDPRELSRRGEESMQPRSAKVVPLLPSIQRERERQRKQRGQNAWNRNHPGPEAA